MVSLSNRLLFPAFAELPQADEIDANYYAETAQGMLLPARTWAFVGEIVNDSLSQLPVLGHRIDVRDVVGDVRSILFYPIEGMFDFTELRTGSTIVIRYAQRCFFSDLATEAIKVEDLNYVKAIPCNLDTLLFVSQQFFEQQAPVCHQCHSDLTHLGGSLQRCEVCRTGSYCSLACRSAHQEHHRPFCELCCELGSVYNIDAERFTTYIPFR